MKLTRTVKIFVIFLMLIGNLYYSLNNNIRRKTKKQFKDSEKADLPENSVEKDIVKEEKKENEIKQNHKPHEKVLQSQGIINKEGKFTLKDLINMSEKTDNNNSKTIADKRISSKTNIVILPSKTKNLNFSNQKNLIDINYNKNNNNNNNNNNNYKKLEKSDSNLPTDGLKNYSEFKMDLRRLNKNDEDLDSIRETANEHLKYLLAKHKASALFMREKFASIEKNYKNKRGCLQSDSFNLKKPHILYSEFDLNMRFDLFKYPHPHILNTLICNSNDKCSPIDRCFHFSGWRLRNEFLVSNQLISNIYYNICHFFHDTGCDVQDKGAKVPFFLNIQNTFQKLFGLTIPFKGNNANKSNDSSNYLYNKNLFKIFFEHTETSAILNLIKYHADILEKLKSNKNNYLLLVGNLKTCATCNVLLNNFSIINDIKINYISIKKFERNTKNEIENFNKDD